MKDFRTIFCEVIKQLFVRSWLLFVTLKLRNDAIDHDVQGTVHEFLNHMISKTQNMIQKPVVLRLSLL